MKCLHVAYWYEIHHYDDDTKNNATYYVFPIQSAVQASIIVLSLAWFVLDVGHYRKLESRQITCPEETFVYHRYQGFISARSSV